MSLTVPERYTMSAKQTATDKNAQVDLEQKKLRETAFRNARNAIMIQLVNSKDETSMKRISDIAKNMKAISDELNAKM